MKPEAIAKLFTPFKNRLINLVTRAQVESVDTSQNPHVITAKVRGRTTTQKIISFQQYGVVSVPPAGADLVRVHLTADPDNPLILSSHHSSQPTGLQEGDAGLYDNRDQTALLTDAGFGITLDAGEHVFNPDSSIDFANGAKITANGDFITAAEVSLDLHKHIGNLGNPTSIPIV